MANGGGTDGPDLTIVSVNVAMPSIMSSLHRGRPLLSGIDKRPVTTDVLTLGLTNLEGDGQAELEVHGGPDKAVYAYPADHFPAWEAEIGRPFVPGAFGENISTDGATESEVCIGDRWTWGDAELEVCQPRTPCYKLAMHAGTAEVGRRMRHNGRSGWYLRVLRPGTVPTSGTIAVHPHPDRVSIVEVTKAERSHDPEVIRRVLAVPALADEWRDPLSTALAATTGAPAGRLLTEAGGKTP